MKRSARAPRRGRPLLAGGGLAAALVVLAVPPASAASVYHQSWYFQYEAAPGEVNDVTVTVSEGMLTITDPGAAGITANQECSVVGASVTCPVESYTNVYINLGDLDDSLTIAPSVQGLQSVSISGGEGDDSLSSDSASQVEHFDGGEGEDLIYGGGGNDSIQGAGNGDTVHGEAGDDYIAAGEGRDALLGGDGQDTLDPGPGLLDDVFGGTGTDTVHYPRDASVAVSINDVADDGETDEMDNVHLDVEGISGGTGDDALSGSASRNVLRGGAGDDHLLGMGGNDQLHGDAGHNTLSGGDGDDVLFGLLDASDAYLGGAGQDYVPLVRATDVTVTMNGLPDDGATGEGDNVGADVEEVTTGPGDDTIVGSKVGNEFDTGDGDDIVSSGGGNDGIVGGRGRDRINGGQGVDSIHGGAGIDTLTSQDKSKDYATCGGSTDSINSDHRDQVAFDCEVIS